MAIEDDDIRDREVWTQVSRQWYLKASDRAPRIGRLYHHLAILAHPNALQQLFFYSKALSISQPFPAAKDSILTLFEPILSEKQTRRLPPVITAYVKGHAFLFMRNGPESFYESLAEFISLLDGHISRVTQRFLEQGYYIGISNCFALLSYGSLDGLLSKALSIPNLEHMASMSMTAKENTGSPAKTILFREALQLFVQTLEINCKRVGDPNVLSFLHVTLVFVVYVSRFPAAIKLLEKDILWEPLVSMLNTLLRFYHFHPRIEGDKLPIPEKNDFRPTPEEFAIRGLEWAASYFLPDYFPPDWYDIRWEPPVSALNTLLRFYHFHPRIEGGKLPIPEENDFRPTPEEFAIRGLEWASNYFPPDWFGNKNIEEENQYKEDASMNTDYRPERVLWLGCWLAKIGKWFAYNDGGGSIGCVTQEYLGQRYNISLANIWNLLSGSFKSTAHYVKSLSRVLTGLKPNLLFPVCMTFLKGAAALPTGSLPETYDDGMSDGFKRFWETKAKHFIDRAAGPLLYNVCILASRSIKKRAIGHGRSPSSSVGTTYSNDYAGNKEICDASRTMASWHLFLL